MMKKVFKYLCIICGSIIGIIFIGFSIYVYLYYPRTAKTFEITTPNPINKILIATQSSDFKDTLVEIICDSLKDPSTFIKGIDLGTLSHINEGNWDRILLISTFMIRLNSDIEQYIKRIAIPEKTLLFVTSGGADWLPEPELKIDALTSASSKDDINDIIQLINDWLRKDIYIKWEPSNYLLALKFFPRVDVKSACIAIANTPERYKNLYPNLVRFINRIGYNHLRNDDIPSALEVFKLNVTLFPNSWNVYDSYGEVLFKSGNLNEAIKNYQRALELNPESEYSRDMLKKMSTYQNVHNSVK
jgi:tetratricopeptide (TPR) repeat protein